MPYFRQIDSNALAAERALFTRARLHIRSGERRLREGKISLGIVTLYDALNSAMQWYISIPEYKKAFHTIPSDDLNNDKTVFDILSRSGVITAGFDYNAFSDLVETALYKDMSAYNYTDILIGIEVVMTQLGVMPFAENELPKDDTTVSQDN